MFNFNISLTSLALVLWSGMFIIAGSIWVLSSQVRKLADLMEQQAKVENQRAREARRAASPTIQQQPSPRMLKMVERTTTRVN